MWSLDYRSRIKWSTWKLRNYVGIKRFLIFLLLIVIKDGNEITDVLANISLSYCKSLNKTSYEISYWGKVIYVIALWRFGISIYPGALAERRSRDNSETEDIWKAVKSAAIFMYHIQPSVKWSCIPCGKEQIYCTVLYHTL